MAIIKTGDISPIVICSFTFGCDSCENINTFQKEEIKLDKDGSPTEEIKCPKCTNGIMRWMSHINPKKSNG